MFCLKRLLGGRGHTFHRSFGENPKCLRETFLFTLNEENITENALEKA